METLFLEIVNMSITASWLIIAVMLFRILLNKAPKSYRILLWGLVAIRLICPISFESMFSLIPSTNTIPSDITTSTMPTIQSGIQSVDNVINPIISEHVSTPASLRTTQILATIWCIGIIVLLLYCLYSYQRLYKKTKESICLEENVYICDFINSPFILGFINPKIYIPSGIMDEQKNIILEHEYAHIKRRDYLWKPLGYLILTLHWFNPLAWLSYSMLCKDIELACDEKVIKDMNTEKKKLYSSTLLDFSTQRYSIMMCPVAFGETSVKERIKSVLYYKKPTFWILLACTLVSILVVSTLMSNPISKRTLIMQVSSVKENGVVVSDMESELYDSYFIQNADIEKDVLAEIKLGTLLEISVGNTVLETYPARFQTIYDIKLYENESANSFPLVIFGEGEYADIRNSQKVILTPENFNIYFEIEEEIGWGGGDGYPFCMYSLVLKDYYQLADADNYISYNYNYDIVKRFYSGSDSSDLTWIRSEFKEKGQNANAYDKIGPRMAFGDELDNTYKTENGNPYVLAKENIYMRIVEGEIYVVDTREIDPKISTIKNDLSQYDNDISDSDYVGKKDVCTHPRGFYVKDNISVQITGEPHIYFTYYLDIKNTDTNQVHRMYFDEKHYPAIKEYLTNNGFVWVKD